MVTSDNNILINNNMANYKIKPQAPAPTEEEVKQQKVRALLQQRASIAQGLLFNMMHHTTPTEDNYKGLVELSVKMADELFTCLYAPVEPEKSIAND